MNITLEEFERAFRGVYRRFGRKFNPEQCEEYYECLSRCNAERMQEAIDRIKRAEKYFPTPEDIEKTYIAIHLEKEASRMSECEKCEGGHVFFERNGTVFANLCAHCNEESVAPLVARVGETIFYAYQKTNQKYEGNPLYRSDLHNMEKIEGATYNHAASRKSKR